MLLVGQQSTWPKVLFIRNRLRIERLVEDGLLLSEDGRRDVDKKNERMPIPLHDQTLRNVQEPPTETEFEGERRFRMRREDRRSSILEEIKRQSGVFFDDVAVDGEETGESEEEPSYVHLNRGERDQEVYE